MRKLTGLWPLFFVLVLSGCFLHSEVTEAPPNTAKSALCKDCHPNEYKEWKQSEHSKSFISANFKRQTGNYEVQKCLPCHAPVPIYEAEKLTLRQNNPEEGVNCISCHLTPEQELAGPHTVIPAHATKMNDPYYLKSDMCGKCHQEHFEQWKAVRAIKEAKQQPLETCQDCHMPAVRRKIIPEGVMQYAHWEQDTKRHTFHAEVPAPGKKKWVKIKYELKEDNKKDFEIITKISHRIPHELPSGTFGFKAIDLIVSLKDSRGLALQEKVHTFYVEQNQKSVRPGWNITKVFHFQNEHLQEAESIEFRVRRRESRMDFGRIIHQEQHRIQWQE